MWRWLMPLFIALASVAPHCATAAPAPSKGHHAGMTHQDHAPAQAPAHEACIGCATPVRLGPGPTPSDLVPRPVFAPARHAMPVRFDAKLDPPPPRSFV